jgi:hypothetical protein
MLGRRRPILREYALSDISTPSYESEIFPGAEAKFIMLGPRRQLMRGRAEITIGRHRACDAIARKLAVENVEKGNERIMSTAP